MWFDWNGTVARFTNPLGPARTASAIIAASGGRLGRKCLLAALHCPPHCRRMIETACQLGHRQWAHTLGYGGHFLTKSRRYSVTFGELRTARRDHRRAQRHPGGELDPWGGDINETTVLILTEWSYVGTGYQAADAHRLALMSADSARNAEDPARVWHAGDSNNSKESQ